MKYFLLLFISVQVAAQVTTKNKKAIALYKRAENFRVRGQFDPAIELLIQAVKKDRRFEEAYWQLGNIYQAKGNWNLSLSAFEKGYDAAVPLRHKDYFYAIGCVCLRSGKYEKAKAVLEKFLAAEKTNVKKTAQAQVWKSQADFALEHLRDSLNYQAAALNDSVNLFPMQYFPTLTADDQELVFTVRHGSAYSDEEDLYFSQKKNNRWQKARPLDNLNSNYREGASAISADGHQLVFTVCGPSGCDLYESRKTGTQWGKPQILSGAINTKGWEAQPSLSADGNELYFVSDRAGGLGGYDIWHSKKNEKGEWTKAVNAGSPVNTPFDEIAPYIHVNGSNLYFASNGLAGMGGYDIYVSEKDKEWGKPMNMGVPLNDCNDQYSFAVTGDGTSAFFSREEGGNRCRIYQTTIPAEFQVKKKGKTVRGTVKEKGSARPLRASLTLFNLKTNIKISQFFSDSLTGEFLVILPGVSNYALHAAKSGYLFHSAHFDYGENTSLDPIVLTIELPLLSDKPTAVLNNIFFEKNEYRLSDDSKTELAEVAGFLKSNSNKIEIGGHTDSQGEASYNQNLSQQRANSVREYLTSAGIAPERITAKGFGAQMPIAPNDNEEARAKNRRIELRVKE